MKKELYRFLEIIAVILTGIGKLVYDSFKEQDSIKAAKIIAAAIIVFWIVYITFRLLTAKGIHKDWGFRKTNFQPTMVWVVKIGVISIIGFIIYGLIRHNTKFGINMLYTVLVYPIWGLAQQLLFISIFAGNLEKLQIIDFNKFCIVVFTSILFCILHHPKSELMIPTFIMAVFCTLIFLRYRNIYPLAIFHGVVGGMYYYFVLNKDAWAELISAIYNTV